MRVLITIYPRMYRQAMALSIQRHRPGLDVRIAPPEDVGSELAEFRPHLLAHNDTDGLGLEDVADVPCRVTVLYSDGLDACLSADGQVSTASDMSTEDLLQVVDAAIALSERETGEA